jgi:hypothetical protein
MYGPYVQRSLCIEFLMYRVPYVWSSLCIVLMYGPYVQRSLCMVLMYRGPCV